MFGSYASVCVYETIYYASFVRYLCISIFRLSFIIFCPTHSHWHNHWHTHTHTYGPIGERAFSFAGNSNAREYTTRVNEFMDCVWALRIYKVQQTYHNKGAKYWSYSNNSNNNQTINIRTYSMQIIIWRKESHTLRTTLNGGVRMLQWTHYTLDESIYLRSVCLVIAIGIFRTFFGYSRNCIKFWD